jgi:hypothetical protein
MVCCQPTSAAVQPSTSVQVMMRPGQPSTGHRMAAIARPRPANSTRLGSKCSANSTARTLTKRCAASVAASAAASGGPLERATTARHWARRRPQRVGVEAVGVVGGEPVGVGGHGSFPLAVSVGRPCR